MPEAWSRRRLLTWGLGAGAVVVAGGATGYELIMHGVLPGKTALELVDGACSVPGPAEVGVAPGRTYVDSFYSRARGMRVSYTLAYPPGHQRGDRLPLVVCFHPYGGDHASNFGGGTLAQALALRPAAAPHVAPAPMAIVCADGGNGYWTAHGHDDPMRMVVDELLPICRRDGLGTSGRVVTTGISMGGYGAILMAEHYPHLVRAAAAISPAIWSSWPQAHSANPTAYASAAVFDANNAVTDTAELRSVAVRVAAGTLDPFYPNVVELAHRLPRGSEVVFTSGCHTGSFFQSQVLPSLQFLRRHLPA